MNSDMSQGTHLKAVLLAHFPRYSYTPVGFKHKTASENWRAVSYVYSQRGWREICRRPTSLTVLSEHCLDMREWSDAYEAIAVEDR
jgi:hypothetical protein